MTSLLSRSVEIKISNNTQNITLMNPRTYFDCGHCSVPPESELSPGSSGICNFQGSYQLWGVSGILVYEAESFTLAIHVCNPIDYNKFSMALGLELSPGKAHLDSLEETYTRMANGTYSVPTPHPPNSHPDIKFSRIIMGKNEGTAQVSNGPVKVTATMTSATDSLLKVMLEEESESGEGSRDRETQSREN